MSNNWAHKHQHPLVHIVAVPLTFYLVLLGCEPGDDVFSFFFFAAHFFLFFSQTAAESVEKDMSITKLNSSNYQEWKRYVRMVLITKDLWFQLHEDRPPAEMAKMDTWTTKGPCSYPCTMWTVLISDAETKIDAWEILAEKYASTDVINILKVEEAVGKARKKPNKSISSWVAYMKSLANCKSTKWIGGSG